MSSGRDWSVTVAITASRWSPDTQAAHTAWLETYDTAWHETYDTA